MSSFATKLEKVLREKGISQSVLSRKLGVDKSLVNKWVKGRHTPSPHFMTKIARELNMTEQALFFDSGFSGADSCKRTGQPGRA